MERTVQLKNSLGVAGKVRTLPRAASTTATLSEVDDTVGTLPGAASTTATLSEVDDTVGTLPGLVGKIGFLSGVDDTMDSDGCSQHTWLRQDSDEAGYSRTKSATEEVGLPSHRGHAQKLLMPSQSGRYLAGNGKEGNKCTTNIANSAPAKFNSTH
jgi:hypothetical protein